MSTDEQVDDIDESLEATPYDYSISSYGADYPVDSLVKRIASGDIVVPYFSRAPDDRSDAVGFQRDFVWPRSTSDRFIESLLLGLPVPGIFLVREQSGRLLVLDGLQRLHTLSSFYTGSIEDQEYRLRYVEDRFRGQSYHDLDPEDRRRLDDSIIHATVIRQDVPTDDQSSVYMVFERLNTGGMNLQPQEIRVALYHGEFVRVLKELNERPAWRRLYRKRSRHFKDMEMILRFFALHYDGARYQSPMKEFLNRYMAGNRDLARHPKSELARLFDATTTVLDQALGVRSVRPMRAVNAAVLDSLMAGIACRIDAGPISNFEQVSEAYGELMTNRRYRSAVDTGTSLQESNVKTRLELATKAFASVQ